MKNELVKVVADTNIIISGVLWHGAPHTLLEIAYKNEIQLLTCSALLQELTEVLQRASVGCINAVSCTKVSK
jgi:putative PIN family toxin of toxin-antitoxin system